MSTPSLNQKNLHPLLKAAGDLIRQHRSKLYELREIIFDPDFKEIYGNLEQEELYIVNEFHESKCFRKIHLEIARFGSLQILHCIFFPNPRFDLPIFGLDLVSGSQGLSAAIVDLSPVAETLPKNIISEIRKLEIPQFVEVRQIPEWGTIFSPFVCFVRPINANEENLFLAHVDKFLNILMASRYPLTADKSDSSITIERLERQKIYCMQQKCNDKTRAVLTRTFNKEWADEYIDSVLFDCPFVL